MWSTPMIFSIVSSADSVLESKRVNQLFEMDEDLDAAGLFLGMDEAGYGPNLGPLVITATAWSTPSAPGDCNFADLLKDVVDLKSTCKHSKLHIADSKEVNKGKYGFQSLETSALSLLRAANIPSATFKLLWQQLCPKTFPGEETSSSIPWFEHDLELPMVASDALVRGFAERLSKSMQSAGLGCENISAQIIPARLFNGFLDQQGSKGVALSALSFDLLSRTWNANEENQTLIIGDKHGGRNRYDEFLSRIVGAAKIHCLEEGRTVSRYRVNQTEFRFQTKGEQHFPVAAASIVAKYLRELAMHQFNRFWNSLIPELKPTKGYPVDAQRFRKEVQSNQKRLKISDEVFWRER